MAATIARPGVISHTGTVQKLVFGEYDGRRSARAEALLEACRRADIDAELSLEIRKTIWEKFVFLVGLSAATTNIRLPIGLIRTNPRTRRFLLDTMREVVAVGRAQGVALSAEYAGGKHREVSAAPRSAKIYLNRRCHCPRYQRLTRRAVQLGPDTSSS
jgi:2-dehydropantoate 2-reductase